MDKKFQGLYLHENAFNLIPQQLFCTKAKNIRESRNAAVRMSPAVPLYHYLRSRKTNKIEPRSYSMQHYSGEKKHDLEMSMPSCRLYKPVSDWLKMLPLDITTVNM